MRGSGKRFAWYVALVVGLFLVLSVQQHRALVDAYHDDVDACQSSNLRQRDANKARAANRHGWTLAKKGRLESARISRKALAGHPPAAVRQQLVAQIWNDQRLAEGYRKDAAANSQLPLRKCRLEYHAPSWW